MQDVQFTIGQTSKISVAFWYPVDGNPWHGSGHYSISCEWVPLDIALVSSELSKVASTSSWDAASAFSVLISVVAFCISIFVGYWVSRSKAVPFTPIDRLWGVHAAYYWWGWLGSSRAGLFIILLCVMSWIPLIVWVAWLLLFHLFP